MNKALLNLPVLLCAVLSLAATVALSAWVFAEKHQPPSLLLDQPMPVPDFTVTDHRGNTLTRDDMLGKVWVCDFFLTRCNGVCPILGLTMADLAEDLSRDDAFKDVRLVSFSVDPEHDTVEKLQRYRTINSTVWAGDNKTRQAAIDKHWSHTRADDQQAFWRLVREGFKLHVGPSENDPSTPVAHSARLVLIDRSGRIRGYYDGMTDEDMPALIADIRRLVDAED